MVSVIGVFTLVCTLLMYSLLMQRSGLSASSLGVLQDLAYGTLVLVVTGLSMIVAGLTSYFRSRAAFHGEPTSIVVSNTLKDSISSRIFVVASMAYGLFFAIVSGTLVIRPGASFSQTYGVNVPSTVSVVCCGSPGQIPQLVVYVTQQVAFLLVPFNLILLFFLSWLIGLNAAIASYAYKGRPQSNFRWLAGFGGIVGLFTACPTCAGLFLLSSVGVSSTLTATLALGSLQTVLAATSLPLLVVTLVLSSRKVRASCSVSLSPQR